MGLRVKDEDDDDDGTDYDGGARGGVMVMAMMMVMVMVAVMAMMMMMITMTGKETTMNATLKLKIHNALTVVTAEIIVRYSHSYFYACVLFVFLRFLLHIDTCSTNTVPPLVTLGAVHSRLKSPTPRSDLKRIDA